MITITKTILKKDENLKYDNYTFGGVVKIVFITLQNNSDIIFLSNIWRESKIRFKFDIPSLISKNPNWVLYTVQIDDPILEDDEKNIAYLKSINTIPTWMMDLKEGKHQLKSKMEYHAELIYSKE